MPDWDADLTACAQLVERGDPDRFIATMAAPEPARHVLFPLYAFNLEVARAPWVTAEPMIAQMRLQWWADVLEEIAAGGPVRRHEVATPLARILSKDGATRLGKLVETRRLDIEKAPFEDQDALNEYFDKTAGFLAVTAAEALGGAQGGVTALVMLWARASGLARYLGAVPELEARGKLPLPDGRADVLAAMAQAQLSALRALSGRAGLRGLRHALGRGPDAAVLEFWQTRALLRRVARDPLAVAEGRVSLSEFGRKWRLLMLA